MIAPVANEIGFRTVSITGTQALWVELSRAISIIVLELMLPDTDGIQLLRLLAPKLMGQVSIVLMSDLGVRVLESAAEVASTLGLFVAGCLDKPLKSQAIRAVLEGHLRHQKTFVPVSDPSNYFSDYDLQSAIDEDQFVIHYQPQIDVASGNFAGLEALVRWQRPESALAYPDSFLLRLEELGLISRLDWIVARRACFDFQKMLGDGVDIPSLSLNFSASSLCDLEFPEKLMNLARECRVDLGALSVEITESCAITRLPGILDVLTRLRMKKVKLSIDDFGKGFSTMQQLCVIPATELKIDKSFVQHMLLHESNRILVLKMIEIGHAFNAKVVAEGVESEEQLEVLRQFHCDVAQGYLIAPPLSADDLSSWISRHRQN